MTTDTVQDGITEKRPFLLSAGKCFLAKNFIPKNTQNFLSFKSVTETDIYFGKGYFFL